MITTPLRILLVEDNEADVLLTRRTIKKIVENPQLEVVEDIASCKASLISFVPDVVISDYNLPTCTGLDILELVKEKSPEVPVIFLTGTIHDEELAENTILAKASGYILKKNMNNLEEKLRPFLKKIVFKMDSNDGIREKLRENKIAINQIYDYLDNLNTDNREQKRNIEKLKEGFGNNETGKNGDDKKA